ncbi:MAG: sigma-54 dependent transcriptional regulator [bacterium]
MQIRRSEEGPSGPDSAAPAAAAAPAARHGRVLVVEDDPVGLKNLVRALKKEGYQVTAASGGRQALERIRPDRFDLILTDLVMGEVDGLEVLDHAKRASPETEVIILTGHATIPSSIHAMKRGAYDYLQKPFNLDELRCVVANALEKARLRHQVRELIGARGEVRGVERLVGRSPAICHLRKMIPQFAAADANILITGESGTGKELVARAVHEESRRSCKRFLAINCGSFTEELLANELFGHEREAFTGALSSRAGLLESADGGTIFFDEVGDMPLPMQAKLLRVVQERELIRVGGVRPVAIDVRIIAATNKDLKRAIESGQFRQDLFYRLNVIPVRLPSLAERKEDVPLLADCFLQKIARKSDKALLGFSGAAMDLLKKYAYPGNVRELENVVERASALAAKETIEPGDLPSDIREMEVFSFHKGGPALRTLEELERDYIDWVMQTAGRNKSRVARILGIDRVSLYRKMKRHQLRED